MNLVPNIGARALQVASLLKGISKAFGASAIVVGMLVLIGWLYDIELLKRISAKLVAMNPATAVCFILCGTSLLLSQEEYKLRKRIKTAALIGAAIVLLICLLKLVSIFTHFHLPVDEVLFAEKLESAEGKFLLPNRMAPNTAFSFVLLGMAFLFLDASQRKSNRFSQLCVIVVILISLLSLYGYIYGVRILYGVMAFIPMAVHTAFGFLILALGVLFARPHRGAMKLIIEGGSAEVLFLELFALVVPLVFGWLQLRGQQLSFYSPEFGTAIFVILSYIISIVFLSRTTWLQHQLIKEKEMSEAMMKEHTQRLQSILDNTSTPIVIKDLKGRYILVNKQFETLFHVTSDDITGKTAHEIFKEAVADNTSILDNEVFETGKTKQSEEIYYVDNEPRTFVTVKFPLRDTKGDMYALCGISTDITYRKELENTLRQNEQQLRSILQNIGEGVVVADKNGKFLSFNKVAEAILGIGATEGPVSSLAQRYGVFKLDGITPYSSDELSLSKALKGISTDEAELFIRNRKFPDGKQISVTGRPILDDKGEVIAGVVVFRDISNRKNLEKIIYENEKRLRLVISSVGEGIAVADTNGKFLLFNKKAEDILGIGAIHGQLEQWSQIYGLYEPDGVTPFPTEKIPLVRALRGETTDNVEMYIKNDTIPEGKIILATGRPICDEQGNVTAGIVIFQDITELKRLENTLEQIQEQYKSVIDFRHRTPESK